MIELHNLPSLENKTKQRVGRGGNRGKNSGKGNKGQKKRAGKMRIGFEGGQKSLIRRTPKIRGYNFSASVDKNKATIPLSYIASNYKDGETLNLATLIEKKVVHKDIRNVRIIKSGDVTIKLNIELADNIYLTKGAKEALNVK